MIKAPAVPLNGLVSDWSDEHVAVWFRQHRSWFLNTRIEAPGFSADWQRQVPILEQIQSEARRRGIDLEAISADVCRPPEVIRKDIASAERRLGLLHAGYKGPGAGGTRARTTTYNANAGKWAGVLASLHTEFNKAEALVASRPHLWQVPWLVYLGQALESDRAYQLAFKQADPVNLAVEWTSALQRLRQVHTESVLTALSTGAAVPDEVLADYGDWHKLRRPPASAT